MSGIRRLDLTWRESLWFVFSIVFHVALLGGKLILFFVVADPGDPCECPIGEPASKLCPHHGKRLYFELGH